jgi:hypothetical protein
MFFPGLMAVTAGEFCVLAMQLEIGSIVFEGRLIERHDIRIPAFVVGMTERAVAPLGVPVESVKPAI